MRPYFFFRFAILFALSAATFLPTSSFGTPANFFASTSNARNPFGFFPTANLLFEAHKSGIVLIRQDSPRKSIAANAAHYFGESSAVIHPPLVESKHLLCDVASQVERSDGNVGSVQTTLQHAMHCGLIHGSTASDSLLSLMLVHVRGLATDVAGVSLGRAIEFVDAAYLHCLADAMEHKPRCFLSDPQGSGKLARANSIFAVGDAPYGHKPMAERERGILENRAAFMRKALAAILAAEQIASFDFADPVSAGLTMRTGDFAVRPLDFSHVGLANAFVCKVADGFDQGVWRVIHCDFSCFFFSKH